MHLPLRGITCKPSMPLLTNRSKCLALNALNALAPTGHHVQTVGASRANRSCTYVMPLYPFGVRAKHHVHILRISDLYGKEKASLCTFGALRDAPTYKSKQMPRRGKEKTKSSLFNAPKGQSKCMQVMPYKSEICKKGQSNEGDRFVRYARDAPTVCTYVH